MEPPGKSKMVIGFLRNTDADALSEVTRGRFVKPSMKYEGGSICNENPFITPSTNALGFNAICQIKDQSVAVIMVHETLFYFSKFNMLQAF